MAGVRLARALVTPVKNSGFIASFGRRIDCLKFKRFTHHDLRHLFATKCIESGVDIPTVSRWMGHSDGGALAMKTYGHLRQEHSQTQAAKVSFGTSEVQRG